MARPKKIFPDYPGKPHSSGQAVIWLDGKATYLGKFNSPESRQRYEDLRAERHLAGKGVKSARSGRVTVAEVAARFMLHADQHYQQDGKPTKQHERLTRTCAVLSRCWGPRKAADIDAPAFDALLTELCQEQPCGRCNGAARESPCAWCQGTGRRKWSRLYLRHITGCIKQIWDWAAFTKLVPPHPLRTVRSVRRGTRGARESAGVRSVPRATVQATVDAAGPVVRDMIELQYLTGARPEEIIGATRERIRTDGVLPEVGRFEGLWVYDVADEWNKNAWRGHGRVLLFGPQAQRLLASYLDRAPTACLFSPREAAIQWFERAGRSVNHDYDNPPGDHYQTRSYAQAVRRACKRAGVAHWFPLQLRHLRATEIRSQYDADHARVVLGHHLAGVTGRYADADLEKAARVAREIG